MVSFCPSGCRVADARVTDSRAGNSSAGARHRLGRRRDLPEGIRRWMIGMFGGIVGQLGPMAIGRMAKSVIGL